MLSISQKEGHLNVCSKIVESQRFFFPAEVGGSRRHWKRGDTPGVLSTIGNTKHKVVTYNM